MNRPKISICVSTFNHENYIGDCIASIIAQDVGADVDIEILVGNDCSTDGTAKIIDAFTQRCSGRIRHIHREVNIGPFENLKSLVREAQGNFVAHLDGDDFWQPGKLKAQLRFLLDHPECTACYTNAWVVNDDLSPLGLFNNELPSTFNLPFLLVQGNFLNHSSILYRAEHKDCVMNCPDFFIDYRVHIALAKRGMLGYLNAPYVTYRHASSQSMVKRSNQKVRVLYLEALIDAFNNQALDDVYDEALQDFVARIVKDGASLGGLSFLIFWFKKLRQDLKRAKLKIFTLGLLRGLSRIAHAALRKLSLSLKLCSGIRIINER